MDSHEQQEVDRFQTKSESGETYTVVEYQTVITRRTGGKTRQMRGTKSYVLSDGRHVSPDLKDTELFKILDGDVIIRRVP